MTLRPRQRHASSLPDAPYCHDRRMVLRFGPGGAFYGCAMFPLCRRTERANVQEPDWFNTKAKGGAK